MLITTKERMVQLTSAIDTLASVLIHHFEKHPEILTENVSRINKKTVGETLQAIRDITKLVGTGDDHYFADIDINYTENSFPTKSY